ncbi:MAG: hypothetical protein R3192_04415 [Woeseiaceae bacterium]|nr:hypothetical protein [Woeseiaceae bacterium]
MISQGNFDNHARSVSANAADSTRQVAKTWVSRLGDILSPAFRLHRYRTTHSRLLQCALGEIDRDKQTC